MIGIAKLVVFGLGVLWIMQHYAPDKLPHSLQPNSYSEWGSSTTPNLSGYATKTGEAARSLAAQIQTPHR